MPAGAGEGDPTWKCHERGELMDVHTFTGALSTAGGGEVMVSNMTSYWAPSSPLSQFPLVAGKQEVPIVKEPPGVMFRWKDAGPFAVEQHP